MMNDKRFMQVISCLPEGLRAALEKYNSEFELKAQEIRLRVNRPVSVVCGGRAFFVTKSGVLTDLPDGDLLTVSRADLDGVFERLCDYSVYSRQNEIAQGFVTLRGGHRAGICGTAVTEDGIITNVRSVSSVNLRIAREHKGCGKPVYNAVKHSRGAIICGAPCSGKTTVLRDLARLISLDGESVSLIDERGELAAVTLGEPQNDIGLCDVFSGYAKAEGMLHALRSMSPNYIMCDELGGEAEAYAVSQCVNSGVKLVVTAHAANYEELTRRAALRKMLKTGAFETIVFLKSRSHAGEIARTIALKEGEPFAA